MESHRTKDILQLMKMLGHKQIQNTLLYEFHVKVAATIEEACKLADAGF